MILCKYFFTFVYKPKKSKMKKRNLLLICGLFTTFLSYAQAPRFALFEHFTQASCGPCAQQNPAFENGILTPNPQIVKHIAYHTSWPGVDEMNAANPTEVSTRVNYYGVNGVPTIFLGGNYKSGSPGSMTQADVDAVFSMGSPVKVEVSEVDNGATRDVTVVVKTVGNVPTGNYKLYTAVIENPRDYSSPPGNNGETHFPNVFRKMYPNDSGESITIPAIGSSVTFTYTYNVDPNWVAANVKVVSFLQNSSTKEILNSGSTSDPIINYSLSSPTVEVTNVPANTNTSFSLSSGNTGNSDEDFIYTLTSDAPSDWNAEFSINSNNYTSTATITVAAGITNNITINVTPGNTRGVATYTLSVSSATNPGTPLMSKKVYVISGVTDLIVNNTGFIGDGVTQGNASNWGTVYTNGLIAANNQGYASTNEIVLYKAINNAAFTGIKNVYYNAGWTFPGLTNEVVAALQNFMDNGGNLFIAGQDIGWEVNDAATSTYVTPEKQNFYKDYLHATYIDDGGSTNATLNAVPTDAIFPDMATATINNFYGGTYLYPDQINTADTSATVIFKYGTSARVGGIRAQTANYKVVYIAPGMEMLNTANANEILKRAHDWFYGYQGTASIDEIGKILSQMSQNYPNPSRGNTSIELDNVNQNMSFELIDITGKTVYSRNVNKGTDKIELNTNNFAPGKYFYRLSDNKGQTIVKSMMIN